MKKFLSKFIQGYPRQLSFLLTCLLLLTSLDFFTSTVFAKDLSQDLGDFVGLGVKNPVAVAFNPVNHSTYVVNLVSSCAGGPLTEITKSGQVKAFLQGEIAGFNSRISYLNSVACDKNGNVYVVGAISDPIINGGISILVFDASGKDLKSIDLHTESTHYGFPNAIAVSPWGDLFVAFYDEPTKTSRIVDVYSPSGKDIPSGDYVHEMPISNLNNPLALAFSPDGSHLFISNDDGSILDASFTNEIFDTYRYRFLIGSLTYPKGLVCDKEGYLYFTDSETNAVYKTGVDDGSTFVIGFIDNLITPYGLALDNEGNLFVANFSGDNVEKFSPKGEFLDIAAKLCLTTPYGIAFDPFGNLSITNVLNSAVILNYSSNGELLNFKGLLFYDPSDSSEYLFATPRGTAFDKEGNCYGTFGGPNTVRKFLKSNNDQNGIVLVPNNGVITHVNQIAFNREGTRFYVTDSGSNVSHTINNKIEEFDLNGTHLGTFTKEGLNNPGFMAFDHQDNMYVSNSGSVTGPLPTNQTINKYAKDGTYLGAFIKVVGTDEPYGIAFDSNDNLYVAFTKDDPSAPFKTSGYVKVYSIYGNDLGTIASLYNANPRGLALDKDGQVYVADYANAVIRKFSAPQFPPNLTPTPIKPAQPSTPTQLSITTKSTHFVVTRSASTNIQDRLKVRIKVRVKIAATDSTPETHYTFKRKLIFAPSKTSRDLNLQKLNLESSSNIKVVIRLLPSKSSPPTYILTPGDTRAVLQIP